MAIIPGAAQAGIVAVGLAEASKREAAAARAEWAKKHPDQARYNGLVKAMAISAIAQVDGKGTNSPANAATVKLDIDAGAFGGLKFDNRDEMGLGDVANSPWVQGDVKGFIELAKHVVVGFGTSTDGKMTVTLYEKPTMWGRASAAVHQLTDTLHITKKT